VAPFADEKDLVLLHGAVLFFAMGFENVLSGNVYEGFPTPTTPRVVGFEGFGVVHHLACFTR